MNTFSQMTLSEAVDRMFTCATAHRCAREEACFVVVQEMKRRLERERLLEEMTRAAAAEEVSDYAPSWEHPGPAIMMVDED